MTDQTLITKADNLTPDSLHTLAKLQGATTNNMLSELEIRNLIDNLEQRTESIVDPKEKQLHNAFLNGLRCVLND